MTADLDLYMRALRVALSGQDPALAQDALWDTREHVRREMTRLAWDASELSESQRLERVLSGLGTPEEVVQRALQQERVVCEALHASHATQPPEPQDVAPRPWPSFLGMLSEPKAYTSVLYLLLMLPTGIFYWVWVWTGLSLSLGLLVLFVGLPLLFLFLTSCRAIALGECRLVEALLDVRMPRRPSILPDGRGLFGRLKTLLVDGFTWTSLLYLVLHLPLGILSFTCMVCLATFSLILVALPIFKLSPMAPNITMVYCTLDRMPVHQLAFFTLLGVLLSIGTLHAAFALGRWHGWLAKALLVKRG